MRVINGVLFGGIGLLFAYLIWGKWKKRESKAFLYLQNHMYLLSLLLAVNGISFAMTFYDGTHQIYIEKEGYGGEEQQEEFLLTKGDVEETVTLMVTPRKLTKEEQTQKMQEAFLWLDEHLKGENESLSEIRSSLVTALDHEAYPFDVEIRPQDYALVDGEGVVKNDRETLLAEGYSVQALESGIETSLTVILWYGDVSEKKDYTLRIFPKEKNKTELLFEKVFLKMKKNEQEAACREGFYLPPDIDGVQLTKKGETKITPAGVLAAGVVLMILLLAREQEEQKNRKKRRREMLLKSYPWFVNELSLLLGAGMQVKNILDVLLVEYEEEHRSGESKRWYGKKRKRRDAQGHADDRWELMAELASAKRRLELGMAEEQVYYRLGRDLELPCYIRLMTLLEQNVKRGGKGITAAFRQEELSALEERKNLAKRYGEEAGTKLLGPMFLLLLVVMLMIMIPAFWGFM